jgi:hypothetical protein
MNGQVKYAITKLSEAGIRNYFYHFYYPEGFTKKDSILSLFLRDYPSFNYTGTIFSGWLHVEIKSPDIDGSAT